MLLDKYLLDVLLFLHGVFIMVYIMSYNLLSLLTLSGPKLVFQPQTPRLRYFLKFEDMIGFSLLNLDKMSPCL